MTEPIFTQKSLHNIGVAKQLTPDRDDFTRDTDWLIRVTRDRTDIGIPLGTQIVVRPGQATGDAVLVVVRAGGEHVLRRVPTSDQVVGVVVGVVVDAPTVPADSTGRLETS